MEALHVGAVIEVLGDLFPALAFVRVHRLLERLVLHRDEIHGRARAGGRGWVRPLHECACAGLKGGHREPNVLPEYWTVEEHGPEVCNKGARKRQTSSFFQRPLLMRPVFELPPS